jgi:deoxyribodipyrimidine photo-lyase
MTMALVWLRRDLRLTDNPALTRALECANRVVPVYIHAPEEDGDWASGGASRWWLHHSLVALQQSFAVRGAALVVRRGPSLAALMDLIRKTGAQCVCWSRLYEPAALARDHAIEAELRANGVEVETANANYLFEPWEIGKDDGTPYRVYSPFARRCRNQLQIGAPLPAPGPFAPLPRPPDSLPLAALQLLPLGRRAGGDVATGRGRRARAAAGCRNAAAGLRAPARPAGLGGHHATLGASALWRAVAAPGVARDRTRGARGRRRQPAWRRSPGARTAVARVCAARALPLSAHA